MKSLGAAFTLLYQCRIILCISISFNISGGNIFSNLSDERIISLFWIEQQFLLEYKGKRAPRSARRARKPLQDNWIKGPRQSIWIKCTYVKCAYEWQYFGGHRWAECPICHSSMKVSIAKRNFLQNRST